MVLPICFSEAGEAIKEKAGEIVEDVEEKVTSVFGSEKNAAQEAIEKAKEEGKADIENTTEKAIEEVEQALEEVEKAKENVEKAEEEIKKTSEAVLEDIEDENVKKE